MEIESYLLSHFDSIVSCVMGIALFTYRIGSLNSEKEPPRKKSIDEETGWCGDAGTCDSGDDCGFCD